MIFEFLLDSVSPLIFNQLQSGFLYMVVYCLPNLNGDYYEQY